MPRPLPVLALALALALPGAAGATSFVYQAALSGPNEFPANASPGTGFTTVTYDDVAHSLHVQITFGNLTAGTTASHIHCCVSPSAATPTAGVATTTPTFPNFPLGVTAGTYDQTFDLTQAGSWNPAFVTANGGTTASAETTLAAGLAAGFAYLNIHTSAFQSGEIRGFLTLVPEPGTAGLLGAGLAVLSLARRRSG